MKKFIVAFTIIAFAAACGGNASSDKAASGSEKKGDDVGTYDPHRGEGKFTKVEVSPALDVAKAEQGNKIAAVKCTSCHKPTDEKLVGPGWAGVTTRHTPEWIMNFITNTDAMIDKDPKAQAQLEICLVRMPNQSLSDDDARNLYEYMRKIDGVK